MLTGLLGTSKQLVTTLEKADWLDRLLIFAALAFFALVVLFILKQRIVGRGLRIAFWWTRLLPSRDRGTLPSTQEVTVEEGYMVDLAHAAACASARSGALSLPRGSTSCSLDQFLDLRASCSAMPSDVFFD